MNGFYDRAGRPLDVAAGTALFNINNNRTVAFTRITGDSPPRVFDVSTVHLVLNHQHGDGPPLIFETMVFGPDDGDYDEDCDRYATERQARNGHAELLAHLAEHRSAGHVVPDWVDDEIRADAGGAQ